MELGDILRKARGDAALTQEQAAEALGVSRQTLSHWENGRTYPDVVSVLKMSEVYAVSLDTLLNGDASDMRTYENYLSESTDTVRSQNRLSAVIVCAVTLGIWALCVLAFFLLKDRDGLSDLCLAVGAAVLPVCFFGCSIYAGWSGCFGKGMWLLPAVFAVQYALSGSVRTIEAENVLYRAVTWPDLVKLPIGLVISLAGLGAGAVLRQRKEKK